MNEADPVVSIGYSTFESAQNALKFFKTILSSVAPDFDQEFIVDIQMLKNNFKNDQADRKLCERREEGG